MLSYRAPKSQVWGHRVERLSAVQLLERATQFTREQTFAEEPQPPNLSVIWTPTRSPAVSESVESIGRVFSAPALVSSCTNRHGEQARALRWKLNANEMRPAAAWIDETLRKHGTDDFSVTLTSSVTFRWRSLPDGESIRCGGMFGFNLGWPRVVTTMFSFVSIEHYRAIKEYLARIGLVDLTDKNLHEARPAVRRPR